MTHDDNAPPNWGWHEPLTFDADGVCQDPAWLRGKTRAELDALSWKEWTALRPPTANARFVLVSGEGAGARPKSKNIEAHECAACSQDLRYPYDRLLKVRVGSFVCRGRLEGGSEWWVCARCGRAYYRAG
jgi:hypothetical protein